MLNNPRKRRIEENKIFLNPKDRITFISIFIILLFILSVSAFGIGKTNGETIDNVAHTANLAGLAYNYNDNCLLYSNELIISNIQCDSNEDCAPYGICLDNYAVCAYFK